MGWYVADGEAGFFRTETGNILRLGPPGRALCRGPEGVFCAGDGICRRYDGEGECTLSFAVPGGVCALTYGKGTVFALSGEADCVTGWSARRGDVRFCAPAGVYPRAMAMRPDGEVLAVAGGAAGEILLLDAQLHLLHSHRVPGVAVGVCFLSRGLAALCAVGEEERAALLLRISPWGVTEPLFSCAEGPCCLACRADRCMVGCHGRVYCLRPDGRVARVVPAPYPARIRWARGEALICDPWQGTVAAPGGPCCFAGAAPEDVLPDA